LVELCIHIANILYLLSFLARDMLWLRLLTCVGLVLGILFFACQPTPLYGPAGWHLLFLFINGMQIWRLVQERRELMLSAEQAKIAETVFYGLSREELVTLLTHVTYRNPKTLRDLPQFCHLQLSPEEQALRNIAFNRLSREELTNLLTRRLWSFLKRLSPTRWRRNGRQISPTSPPSFEPDAVPDSAGG